MRLGLVSSAAVSRVGRITSDTGPGPVGAVSSDHIDAAAQQKAGKNFGNPTSDWGPGDAGEINARANARQYGPRAKGKRPSVAPPWKAKWFGGRTLTKLGDRTRDPESDVGGPSAVTGGATGTGWLDRNRRGGA